MKFDMGKSDERPLGILAADLQKGRSGDAPAKVLFKEIHHKMASGGYLVLGNAEQPEDATNLFEVEFAATCSFYRPVNGSWRFSRLLDPS